MKSKRPKPSSSSSTSKALVRVTRTLERVTKKYPGEELAPRVPRSEILPVQLLGDEADLGALGLVEVKLTPQEEQILSRPVDDTRVLIKPSGQPYLSHPEYTRWFNEAFGRLGWSIVPKAKPLSNGANVVVPYVLYIHGKPAAFAYGEQDYHDNNREQTYGDAAEATVASALRRMAKRLGVGLELWDRAWIDEWIHEHCIKVRVVVGREKKVAYQWRKKDAPPFWNEVTGKGRTAEGEEQSDRDYDAEPAEQPQRRAPAREERPAGHNPKDGEPITEGQVRRLWVIVRNSGRSDEVVKTWLRTRYNLDTSKKIKRGDYDFICKCIEAEGSLPLTGAPGRSPGQEG